LQQDGVQFEDSFYSAERFTYIVSHIVDYIEASTDVVIDGDGLLTAFTGDYITTDMQMLLDGTDTGTLWHDSGEPWYIEDVGGGYTCKGHTFRLRVVSEFNTTEMYLTWLDDQREQAIKSIPWKGVITLNASGEFTWAHNLGFTQYIVLLTPFQQSMPNLYVTATANAIVVSGGVASGKVIYKIELNLR